MQRFLFAVVMLLSVTTAIADPVDPLRLSVAGPASVIAGGPSFELVLTLRNSDSAPATNVTLDYGTEATMLGYTPPGNGTCGPWPGQGPSSIRCTFASIAPGEVIEIRSTQRHPAAVGPTLQTGFYARAYAPFIIDAWPNASPIPVVQIADARITSNIPASAVIGAPLTYRFHVVNAGPSVGNLTFTHDVPAGATFVSLAQTPPVSGAMTCTTPAAGATGTILCSREQAADVSETFTFDVTVQPLTAASLAISASADARSRNGVDVDPNPANNSVTGAAHVAGHDVPALSPLMLAALAIAMAVAAAVTLSK